MKKQLLTLGILCIGIGASAQTFTNYTTSDGLLNDNVNCVDVDASDNVWFGTQGGVSMFDGANWTNYTTTSDPNLVDNNITAIYVAGSGDIWVGSDFGVSVLSGGNWTTYTTTDGLGNNQVKCIAEDASGDIWFGTNSGVTELAGSTWTSYGTSEGLPFGGVTAITLESNGDLWMGSGLGGVLIYNGSGFLNITSSDGLVDDRLRAIVIDDQNNRWFGTSEGISVFNSSNTFMTNHTTIFTLPPPDTLNPIEDVKMDSQGNIWAGVYVDYLVTEGGVCAYNGNQWIEYHVSDGLIGPVVRALAIDGNDDVWVATSTGVSKISDHSIGLTEQKTTAFTVYPNPADDLLFIRTENPVSSQDVALFDATSKQVSVEGYALDANTLEFRVDHLSPGVYYCRIASETQKIILR